MEPQEQPTDTNQPLNIGKVDDGEVVVAIIHRHIFGLIIIYLQAAVGLFFSLGLIYFLAGSVGNSKNMGNTYQYITLAALLVIILAVLILMAITLIYHKNKLVITDKNLTQTLQFGLFSQKISQLTLANVEDVTAEETGIFPTLFNFGTLKIETAGEASNFHFLYCPNPSYFAKQILEAREQFVLKPR